ncbi:MAG: zinc-dependent alcohol dehydrogenase family protein [Burkholderiales bacterium]|nr:zinc-dependent alcohol dehydrogenase family protein [Burkholderiales bacterium]
MCCLGAHAPLTSVLVETPPPNERQLSIRVHACGVCRTDLHVVDGELPQTILPIVPGHEIVGTVESIGTRVNGFRVGDRVGVPWLGHVCGQCDYCRAGQENLCEHAQFHGYTLQGGFADHAVADARFCFHLPQAYSDVAAAPLLCAGLIGYRAYKFAGPARRLGIYGFGAAAHIITQIARCQGREVYAFTRPDDIAAQRFAMSLGARWAGDSTSPSPQALDAAILFAPVGELVPVALAQVRKGGTVVCAGIHMSDIPQFSYELLWGERVVRSVANLTRADGLEFMKLAGEIPLRVETKAYPLREANRALDDLRTGRFNGAAVLTMDSSAGANL